MRKMAYSWYFTREDIELKSPSREHGISSQVEAKYRRDGARFIINASNTLGLHYDTTATGVTFYHRFFMIQSFKTFDRWLVASACLLLAGKVEETPKKCKDILKVAKAQLTEHQWARFGGDPKEELLTHERILLQTIKFDLQVQHPYGYLLKFAKSLKGDKSKIEKLVQKAWNFINDSLCTTLCLQWEPQAIAVAFLYLGGKVTKYDLQGSTASHSKSWWRHFVDTVDCHDLESICHQVLDMYSDKSMESTQEDSMAQDTGSLVPGGSILPLPAQYLISTAVPGGSRGPAPVSTPATPTAQQQLAYSTLNVCVVTPPVATPLVPQLLPNTASLVQPLTLLSYQPQMVVAPQIMTTPQMVATPQIVATPLASQYRASMQYTPVHVMATTPPATTPIRTPTAPQTFPQVWH